MVAAGSENALLAASPIGGRRLLLMEAVGIDDLTTLLQYLATNGVRENIDSVR